MRTRLLVLILAAAGSLMAGRDVQAQFRFSIGGSGWSVGNSPYGYGYGGYGYNPYYYRPPVVNRNYYYYDDVPQQAVAPAKPYAGPGVTVRNPAGSKVKLTYLLDDSREEEIGAGETQKLTEKGSYIVSFDRGGEHGTARYTISEGLYEFTMTSHGWELYRQKEVSAETLTDPKVKPNPVPKPAEVEPPKPID